MITSDFHVHTSFSFDSEVNPEQMVESAIKKGMRTICITDHYDKDCFYHGEEMVFDLDAYWQSILKLQQKYQESIHVCMGIELGLQPHLQKHSKEITERYPFDFVIGSVHFVRGLDLYERDLFLDMSDEEVYRAALEDTMENIKKMPFIDVVGHLDYAMRYGKAKQKSYVYEKFADQIDPLLKYLIAQGIGLELNMAGLRFGLDICNPHPDVIRRYRQLGGEIITIGSDAHRPEQVAYDYRKATAILEGCGFKFYTEFYAGEPVFKQLV